MSKLITPELINEKAKIVEAPKVSPHVAINVDRSFELPKALYGATVACYLGFLAITAMAFGNSGLILPMTIFTFIIVAGFGVPGMWTLLKPETKKARALDIDNFTSRGVMTHTGRLKARDAAIQVLILPVLVLLWGLAVVTIAATI